jgi:diaminopimelate decarboxylase
MPRSLAFKQRLFPPLPAIAELFGTPYHIYDDTRIRESCERVLHIFGSFPDFWEYYAAKAPPNPHILGVLRMFGFGFDWSSIPELELSRQIGASDDDIIFISNNISTDEFETALSSDDCIPNLDDVSFIDKLPALPHRLSFRYNPGERRVMGNAMISNPVESKYRLLELAAWAEEALQIRFEFLKVGGGLGIAYRPDNTPLDIKLTDLGRKPITA